MKKTNGFGAFAAVAAMLVSGSAHAVSFDTDFLNTITDQNKIDGLLQMVSEGAAYKGHRGASPLGLALGLELTVDAVYIPLSDEIKGTLTSMGTANPPEFIGTGLVTLRKGLPMNIDLGVSILPVSIEGISMFSAHAQWAPIAMGQGLNVAGRASFTSSTISILKASTFAFEGIGSFKAGIIEPFAGIGLNFSSTTLDVDDSLVAAGIERERSFVNPKVQLGMNFNLGFFRLGGLFEHNFAGFTSYGVSTGFAF